MEGTEQVEQVKGSLEGLVIGEVLTCGRHPNADKLSVTTVNIGASAPVQIVCGAPNVAAGQKVVVAPVGTTVYPTAGEPFLIKKAKIRGEESCGMICADDEIGLGADHSGIIILPESATPGTMAAAYYKISVPQTAIHIGLTPNRSDANSHIGVAKDVCAYLSHHKKTTVRVSAPTTTLNVPKAAGPVSVTIADADACKRYAGLYIKGVKVAPSPDWLLQRLKTIGVRSINNIVDVTNFVLHEFGQPLHAFDAEKIGGGNITVQCLPEGTPFLGLDGKERKLIATDLMICDANGPLAMGGVFGGLDSGIADSSCNIFLESAYFNSLYVRRSSMHHILRTDAAQHFEKGVDINNVIPALLRAAEMVLQLAGGEIVGGIVDVYPDAVDENQVITDYNYIRRLSGKHYSDSDVDGILTALGFGIEKTGDRLTITVPTNKPDVTQPADLVEEVLRIDGLNNINIPSMLIAPLVKSIPNDRQLKEHLSELLCGLGAMEIITNSIVNSKYYPDRTDLVRMLNSLTSELDVMRPSLTESGLEVVNYNRNRKNGDLFLFEFGNVYRTVNGSNIQEQQLGIWTTGNRVATGWEHKAVAHTIYYLKGVINLLAAHSGIANLTETIDEGCIVFKIKNKKVATVAAVTAARLAEFDIKQDVYTASIQWDEWYKAAQQAKTVFKEIPKYPTVSRDLALVVDDGLAYDDVAAATEKLQLPALQSFELFDVFESDKLGAGKKSFALNFTFRLDDRTLTDAETDGMMAQIADIYRTQLSAQIREK